MNTCIKCSKKLPPEALWCPWCGKKQAVTKKARHAKRPAGMGTITRRSGRRNFPYVAKLPAIYTEHGPVRTSLGSFPTYEAAAQALDEALSKTPGKRSTTLESLYNIFANGNYYKALSKAAQNAHKNAWTYFSEVTRQDVKTITTGDFQAIVDDMSARGLKRETVAKVRNLASLLCQEAMSRGLMTVNYGRLVKLPKEIRTEQKPFNTLTLAKLWELAKRGRKDAATVILYCYTGMRPSELLGVEIGTHLHKSSFGYYFQTGSKTEAGMNRIIPLPDIVQEFLLLLQAGRDSGPLIATPTGKSWRQDNWRSRVFNPLMKEIGEEWATPYTCRHTYSNMQKRRGIDPEIMMEVMGHEDYSTSVEKYHTTTEEDLRWIMSAVDGFEVPKAGPQKVV